MRCRQVLSINMLPDDVLLEIFDSCADKDQYTKKEIEGWWQTLVHVCRRWRSVVFGSPRRLQMRLACAPGTPAKDTLDIWPALPLVISDAGSITEGSAVDNIVAVLGEHSNRVCQILLHDLARSPLEEVLAAMQVSFTELTYLQLASDEDHTAVVPDSFLDGSAPLLQHFSLSRIPFPGLPKLLLSATHLNSLNIQKNPHTGYFSPEAMLTALSVLTSLKVLHLGFQSPRSFPDQARRRSPSLIRTVLLGLEFFWYKGNSEYLEDLLAGIDAPRIRTLFIVFFNDIVFDTPQLTQFMCRTPTLKSLEKAYISFGYQTDVATVRLSPKTYGYPELWVQILCRGLDWQVSSLGQVCASCFPPLSALEDLHIYQLVKNALSEPDRIDDIENTQWLELLRPFAAVKKFKLSGQAAGRIVPALQELVGDRTTEVLPALENIILQDVEPGPVQESIRQFVAARQVTGHPITVY